MRRVLRWLPVWLALVIGAALPGVATATFPGQNGMIAFARDGDIWVVNPDGTKLRQVTTDPRWDTNPAWSPDGKTIAFSRSQSRQPDGSEADIWTIRPDGTGRRQLTSAVGLERDPAWNPAGTRIVYTYLNYPVASELRTIGAGGTNDRELISADPERVELLDPDWGPGGQRIVYADVYDCGFMKTVRLDGTNSRTIFTSPCFSGAGDSTSGHSWSPDGTRIAFRDSRYSPADGQHDWLSTISPTGADLRQLVGDAFLSAEDTSWSPNGARIAFSSLRNGQWGVYTITPDGTDERPVIQNAREPAWQPRRAGSPVL